MPFFFNAIFFLVSNFELGLIKETAKILARVLLKPLVECYTRGKNVICWRIKLFNISLVTDGFQLFIDKAGFSIFRQSLAAQN